MSNLARLTDLDITLDADFGSEPLGLGLLAQDPAIIATGSIVAGWLGCMILGPLAIPLVIGLAANDIRWASRQKRAEPFFCTIDTDAKEVVEIPSPEAIPGDSPATAVWPPVAKVAQPEAFDREVALRVREIIAEPSAVVDLFGAACPNWVSDVVSQRRSQLAEVMSGQSNRHQPEPIQVKPNHDFAMGSTVREPGSDNSSANFEDGSGDGSGDGSAGSALTEWVETELRKLNISLGDQGEDGAGAAMLIKAGRLAGMVQSRVFPLLGVKKGDNSGYKKFKELWDAN